MSSQPPVVINKPKSVWHSIFWASCLMVVGVTACACITGIAALNIVGEHFDQSLSWAGNLTETMQHWKAALPPALADAINDERNLQYVKNIEVDCKLVPDERGRDQHIVVTVTNQGDKVVSLAAVRVTAMSADGVPVCEQSSYAAFPVAAEDEFRGPLLPGSKRTFSIHSGRVHSRLYRQDLASVDAEIVELRTWLGPVEPTPGDAIDKQASAKASRALPYIDAPGAEAQPDSHEVWSAELKTEKGNP